MPSSQTYTTDTQVPDSAGTGTAYVGGVKTRNGVIGYDERVTKGDCASTAEEKKVTTNTNLMICTLIIYFFETYQVRAISNEILKALDLICMGGKSSFSGSISKEGTIIRGVEGPKL